MKKVIFILLVIIFNLNLNGQASFCEICSNGLDDDGNGLIDCDDPLCQCQTQLPITICYIPNSRCSGNDCGYTFDGSHMLNYSTSKLENNSNFGSGGIVNCEIELLPINGTITVNKILSSGCNIFFIGGFGGVACSGQAANQIPLVELNAVRDWSLINEKNLAIVTQVNAESWGYLSSNGNINPDIPTTLGQNSKIFNGPFGVVTRFNQGGCYQGGYSSFPINGCQILATDSSPNPKVVIAIDNETNDIIVGDVDIFTNYGGISFGANIVNNNDILFGNVFSLACIIITPEICNNGIDDDGDGLIDSEDEECQLGNVYFLSLNLCQGQTCTVNGADYSTTGIFEIIITGGSFLGCDSIIILNLVVNDVSVSSLEEQICEGETFIINGINYSATGSYQITIPGGSFLGCDSIVTLDLTVTPQQILEHVVSGCTGAPVLLTPVTQGANYEWSDGAKTDSLITNSPGIFTVSVSDLTSCIISQEIFTVTFSELPSPTVSVPDPVCVGNDVLLTASGSSGNYQWFDAASGGNLLGTGPSLLLLNVQSGFIIHVQGFQGGIDTCTSPRTSVEIQVLEENLQFLEIDTVICAESFIELPWGEKIQPETNVSLSYIWQNSITGCDSLNQTVNVYILDMLSLSLPSLLTLQLGDSVLLEPVISFLPDSLIWLPPDGLSCTNCLQPRAQPTQSTDYMLTIWSIDGCLVTASVRIEVKRDIRIYIPNVFSPNGDGINDMFAILGNRKVSSVRKLTMYDRWGGTLWEGKDFLADGAQGWDGLLNGRPMPSGVYVWLCEIELIDGTVEVLVGDVTLVR